MNDCNSSIYNNVYNYDPLYSFIYPNGTDNNGYDYYFFNDYDNGGTYGVS